jgi:hypothetical protein
MELTIINRENDTSSAILNFMDFYHSLQMTHLASDLLEKGLSHEQISDAVIMAAKIATSSGIDRRKHFMPIYSARDHEIIKDCKLSRVGYGLVLMNANPNLSIVGDFQVSILKEFLKNKD